jgi:hypothetical protein
MHRVTYPWMMIACVTWVLWGMSKDLTMPVNAFETRAACIKAAKETEQVEKSLGEPPTITGISFKTSWVCFPHTIDPRERRS